ncbi:MAG: transporter [Fibrobacter sp.]|nr:transporter [Fibrobacter sp.]
MFKKIILALAIFVGASFATWDYYPIPQNKNGGAEAGLYYDKDHRWSQAGLKMGARLTMIKSLEIAFTGWGYQFWNEEDCSGCVNGGDGLRDLTIGGRFEIAPMITAFLDFNLPVGDDEYDGAGTNPPSSGEFSIYAGAQFSAPTKMDGLLFGTEAGFLWGFEHDNHERGLDIHVGAEVGYTIPKVGLTPYIGMLLKFRLSESVWYDGNDTEHGYADRRSRQYNLWMGIAYDITPMITVKGQFIFRNEKYKGVWTDGNPYHLGGDATGLYVAAVFNF